MRLAQLQWTHLPPIERAQLSPIRHRSHSSIHVEIVPEFITTKKNKSKIDLHSNRNVRILLFPIRCWRMLKTNQQQKKKTQFVSSFHRRAWFTGLPVMSNCNQQQTHGAKRRIICRHDIERRIGMSNSKEECLFIFEANRQRNEPTIRMCYQIHSAHE